MHLPHQFHKMTNTRARATPAAVPPAIAPTGMSDVDLCTVTASVGKLPEPPVVSVVVTNVGEAVTLTVTNTGVDEEWDVSSFTSAEAEVAGAMGARAASGVDQG